MKKDMKTVSQEITTAKMVISSPELTKAAQIRFSKAIAAVDEENKHKFLNDGEKILRELISDYAFRKNCFEVVKLGSKKDVDLLPG